MADDLAKAPTRFRDLIQQIPDGWRISERLLEPQLRLRRGDGRYVAELFGRRSLRDTQLLLQARSLSHDWVADGDFIRPLPYNIGAVANALLAGRNADNLTFSDVVALLGADHGLIKVEADSSVYSPARAQANLFDGALQVPGLTARLYPYQSQGVQWMLDTVQHTGGLILADEMGLGKTIQIISLLLSRLPQIVAPALIVCPTSLVANWRKEILRFGPQLSVLIHRGPHRTGVYRGLQRAHVVITTYDTLVSDQSIFRAIEWSWLVLDEAQAVKNPESNRRMAVASIPRRWTVPMTGTPVETSLVDLWSLIDIAIPGLLGKQSTFEEQYPDNDASARALALVTDPVVLRRRVADVAGDLPERIDIDIPLELGADLALEYNRIREETIDKYPVAGALVATGQLQLFCAHPWLRSGSESPDYADDAIVVRTSGLPLMTPKVERTVAILREAFAGHRKVLVFAIFNRCSEIIREAIGDLGGVFWNAINGSTRAEDRQEIVDAFTLHEGPACLVLNPKAAGAGLNITAATVVIHYTQAWNPALEAQASARAHRRGQTEPVVVYRLFFEDTVERVMVDRAQLRRELGNDAVPVSTRNNADLRLAMQKRPGGEIG